MLASQLADLLQKRISEHGDHPVACYGGQPLYDGPVSDVAFYEHTGMDGDLPNPHFMVECR